MGKRIGVVCNSKQVRIFKLLLILPGESISFLLDLVNDFLDHF